jgi:transcriptional regulator with XRE-family HTH domain
MDNPGRGAPFSVRTLADAAGLRGHSLIGHLLTGKRHEAGVADAHAIAEAVGVAVLVLFAPSASPDPNETTTDAHPENEEKTT